MYQGTMRVALCQINTVVGGFVHNVDKICSTGLALSA